MLSNGFIDPEVLDTTDEILKRGDRKKFILNYLKKVYNSVCRLHTTPSKMSDEQKQEYFNINKRFAVKGLNKIYLLS